MDTRSINWPRPIQATPLPERCLNTRAQMQLASCRGSHLEALSGSGRVESGGRLDFLHTSCKHPCSWRLQGTFGEQLAGQRQRPADGEAAIWPPALSHLDHLAFGGDARRSTRSGGSRNARRSPGRGSDSRSRGTRVQQSHRAGGQHRRNRPPDTPSRPAGVVPVQSGARPSLPAPASRFQSRISPRDGLTLPGVADQPGRIPDPRLGWPTRERPRHTPTQSQAR